MLIKTYPVTRWLILLNIGIPLLFNIIAPGYQNYLLLNYASPYITEYKQYYRYITFQLVSSGLESDICLLVMLLFTFKKLERVMGPKKYIVTIVGLMFYNFLITALLVHFGLVVDLCLKRFSYVGNLGYQDNDEYGPGLPGGLICCVVGLFHFYKKYVPIKYKFSFKLTNSGMFSNKKTAQSTEHNPVIETSSDVASSKLPTSEHAEESNNAPRLNIEKENKIVFTDHFFINTLFFLLVVNNYHSLLFLFSSWIVAVLFDFGILPGANLKLPKWFSSRHPRGNYRLLSNYNSIISPSTSNFHADTPLSVMSNGGGDGDDENDDEDEDDNENTEPVRPLAVQIMNTFSS